MGDENADAGRWEPTGARWFIRLQSTLWCWLQRRSATCPVPRHLGSECFDSVGIAKYTIVVDVT